MAVKRRHAGENGKLRSISNRYKRIAGISEEKLPSSGETVITIKSSIQASDVYPTKVFTEDKIKPQRRKKTRTGN